MSENDLKVAVAKVGPVSVSIDTSYSFLVSYTQKQTPPNNGHTHKSGVYYDKNCSTTHLDHAILVIGYGATKDGKDYWLSVAASLPPSLLQTWHLLGA